MEDPLGSIFNYQESFDQLRQKLFDTVLELETMKNIRTELLKLLKIAYRERDQAREQLQSLVRKLAPFTSNELKSVHESLQLQMFQATKANSSITESNSPSHVSSPVDSLLEAVSSPEFSNVNVAIDSHNLGYLQDFSGGGSQSLALVSSENPTSDLSSAVIDCLAKGKVLPQKGKLLQAVMDSGPLLQTLLLSGSLPTWRNPPPLSAMKTPPLTAKDFDAPVPAGIVLNPFANTLQKSSPSSSQSSQPINLAGVTSGLWNNACQLTSNAGVKSQFPSGNQLRHQFFL